MVDEWSWEAVESLREQLARKPDFAKYLGRRDFGRLACASQEELNLLKRYYAARNNAGDFANTLAIIRGQRRGLTLEEMVALRAAGQVELERLLPLVAHLLEAAEKRISETYFTPGGAGYDEPEDDKPLTTEEDKTYHEEALRADIVALAAEAEILVGLPPAIGFIRDIVDKLYSISEFFYTIYLEIESWGSPWNFAASYFYDICLLFAGLSWGFYYFNEWVSVVTQRVIATITLFDLETWFKDWKQKILDAYYWSTRFLDILRNEVNDWWEDTQETVKSWIGQGEDWLSRRIDDTQSWLATLQADFDNFVASLPNLNEILSWFSDWWSSILANIIAWGALTSLEIDTLINSRIREWLPFYDSLVEFFTNPLEWMLNKFTDWFLGEE